MSITTVSDIASGKTVEGVVDLICRDDLDLRGDVVFGAWSLPPTYDLERGQHERPRGACGVVVIGAEANPVVFRAQGL
jgi:hypothetical protein